MDSSGYDDDFNTGEFCQHCGRQLEVDESQSADGCQFCAGCDDENDKSKNTTERGGGGFLALLLTIAVFWLIWKLMFGWFFP